MCPQYSHPFPTSTSSTMAPPPPPNKSKRERFAKGIGRVVDRLQAPFSPRSRAPSPQPGSTSDLIGVADPLPAFPIPNQLTTQPLPPQGFATPAQLMPNAGPAPTTASAAPIVANKLSEVSTSDFIGGAPLYRSPISQRSNHLLRDFLQLDNRSGHPSGSQALVRRPTLHPLQALPRSLSTNPAKLGLWRGTDWKQPFACSKRVRTRFPLSSQLLVG